MKDTYILGLSSFAHESSCALLKNGEIRGVYEEERFNREKHTWKFPRLAISHALQQEGITIKDIDHFTFYWVPYKEVRDNLWHVLRYFPDSINLFKAPSGHPDLSFLPRIRAMQNVGQTIRDAFALQRTPRIAFIEHHLCHAASTFFVSPFKEAAILTIDGRGESTCTMMAAGKENHIRKIKEIRVPHSLGHLYAAVTDYLGFRPFFDEWKVMGMSAYGKDTYVEQFTKLINFAGQGEYLLDLRFFKFHTYGQASWLSDLFLKTFGPRRKENDPYEQRHFDIAFALQAVVEKTGVYLARSLHEVTGLSQLCMTGGVVLNCLMNKEIVEQTGFKEYFFQPIANDAGTSLGSALYFYHQVLGRPRSQEFSTVYLGNEFTNDEIERVLKTKNVTYHRSDDIAREAAQQIAQGRIVGWFQGRMEAGPRALGNRSITVNPTDSKMKDRLNARVKKREFFRPFAPSVLEEDMAEYFHVPKGQKSPYMILIGDVREDKKAVIPAVTHADGTARVHSVRRSDNPKYWNLINEFKKITGVPVLLNTSFNENEPIVCTPEDALNCFLRTEFDALAIGDYLVVKDNHQ
jgi:carbamoyltransferase